VDDVIVSIDIGSNKVCAMIGRIGLDNKLEILGKGTSVNSGVKKGSIKDIDATARSIREAVQKAEFMSGLKVKSAYANITGMNVTIVNNKGKIAISSDNREITSEDVERLLFSVKNISLPENSQIIDIIPIQYIVDGSDEIVDPVGMSGVTLEVEACVVGGKIVSVQNIIKSIERAGLTVDGIIIESLAAAEVCFSKEERESRNIIIDVGGGITDISVFDGKRLIFYDSIPVGGDYITNDISMGMKISYQEAEKIKREYELALSSLIENDHDVVITDINSGKTRSVKISQIVEIIEARVNEIFMLSKEMIENSGIDLGDISEVILAGRGISYMDGVTKIAGEIFNVPVRIASYRQHGNFEPEYAVAAGMIMYVSGIHKSSTVVGTNNKENSKKKKSVFEKIADFFSKIF